MYGFFLPRHKRGVKPEADINNPFVITGRSLCEGGLINLRSSDNYIQSLEQKKCGQGKGEARKDFSFNSL